MREVRGLCGRDPRVKSRNLPGTKQNPPINSYSMTRRGEDIARQLHFAAAFLCSTLKCVEHSDRQLTVLAMKTVVLGQTQSLCRRRRVPSRLWLNKRVCTTSSTSTIRHDFEPEYYSTLCYVYMYHGSCNDITHYTTPLKSLLFWAKLNFLCGAWCDSH